MSLKKQMVLLPQQGECAVAKFLKQEIRKTFYNKEIQAIQEKVTAIRTQQLPNKQLKEYLLLSTQ